jgi:hypothetical protein
MVIPGRPLTPLRSGRPARTGHHGYLGFLNLRQVQTLRLADSRRSTEGCQVFFVTSIKHTSNRGVAKPCRCRRSSGFFHLQLECQRDPCIFLAKLFQCMHARTWPNQIVLSLALSIRCVGRLIKSHSLFANSEWPARQPARHGRARRGGAQNARNSRAMHANKRDSTGARLFQNNENE